MGGIDMKSIEERAKEYSLKDFDGYYTGRERAVEEGYIAGATEQNDIDIDKACEWLDRYLHLFVMKGHINHSVLEQEFRKAMEE